MGVKREERPLLERVEKAARQGVTALRFAGSLAGSVVRGVLDAAADIAAARNASHSPTPRPATPRPAAPRPAAPRPAARPTPPRAEPPRAEPARAEPPQEKAGGSSEKPAEEPIQTPTLARLLAQQGHTQRAIAMYEALLAAQPGDEKLQRELDDLRNEGSADSPAEKEMVSIAVDERTVWVSWQVSDTGIARASRLLGHPGKLVVRLAVTAPDPAQIVRTETRELTDIQAEGEWVVRDLPDGARATAAVGIIADGRFISIAHHRAR